jgi:tetratricopeptide (TPR) repeat protein
VTRRIASALAACLLLAAAASAGEAPREGAPEPSALIARLGSESFAEREGAMADLAALGEEAVGPLEAALKHPDAEVRWRAAAALHRIRWRIGPKLAARIGGLMHDFERRPLGEREMICRDLAMVGLSDSVPTLSQILRSDPSPAVRQAAARALVILGDEGLEALLEAGVKTEGLNPYTVAVRIHLGNSYLERKEFAKALDQYQRALEIEPKNSIVHYNVACTYAQMGQADEALDALERSVECGYRDVDWMEKDGDLDSLRDLPRYQALVRKLRERE